MSNKKTAGWLLLCASSVAMAGCGTGGSKAVSKAEIISKGDAICQKATSHIAANPPNSDPARATSGQLKAYARFFQQISNATQTSITQLAALGKPGKEAALLTRLIANGRASATSNQRAAQAAQNGDIKAFKAVYAARPASGSALAKQFGFKVCAQHS